MSELDEIEKSIKIAQVQIDNIDYNMKGLRLRREKLIEKLAQLNTTKESFLQNAAGTITVPAE